MTALKILSLLLALTFLPNPAQAFYSGDLPSEKIWLLTSAPKTTRWLIIHEKTQDKRGTLYHVEVLELKDGQKDWEFKRLSPHLALTENALRWSIVKFQRRGDVYPESYNDAYKDWAAKWNSPICTSNVNQCLEEPRFRAEK